MGDPWEVLLPRVRELHDIGSAIRLLSWDQAVMMPQHGNEGRSQAMATLEGIAHSKLVDPALGDLLAELEDVVQDDEVRAASVRNLKRDRDKAVKVPGDLVRALAETGGRAYQAWTEARPADDFSILRPHLEKMVALKREEADALGWEVERYDALLDLFEPEMTAAQVERLFDELTARLQPLAESILAKMDDPPDFLTRSYDPSQQMDFSRWLVTALGFDTTRGRLDVSPHPFTVAVGAGDVRQTTRTLSNALLESIYATIHETGHALYEQGIPEDLLHLPAGGTPSLGIHESQSRLWENHVGRSRAFTDFLLPRLKERFTTELGMVTPDDFHRGVNHPRRTLIRVSADEVTYNLHVVLRFELELALFRNDLEVADLPEAWDDAMERHIGIRPENEADGILQDMHWSIGALGYFPTYTIGTLYAAAFYDQAQSDLGDLSGDIRSGDFSRLLEWLREKVHSRAYLVPARELAKEILGEPVSVSPFLDYLSAKYNDLYDVSA